MFGSAHRYLGWVVVVLLSGGCAVFLDFLDEEPATPLALAAHRGDLAAVRSLVAAGADLNAYDASGSTPLHWAARGGHPVGPHRCGGEAADRPGVVEGLIQLGASPNSVDQRRTVPGGSSGWTPLHVALHHEQFATADRLLSLGADPNILSRQGTSVMRMAADEGAPRALLASILARGFDPQQATRGPR